MGRYDKYITKPTVICGDYALYKLGLISATVPVIQAWSEIRNACDIPLCYIEYKYCPHVTTVSCTQDNINDNLWIPSVPRAIAECLSNVELFDEGCIFEAIQYLLDTAGKGILDDALSYARYAGLDIYTINAEIDSITEDICLM